MNRLPKIILALSFAFGAAACGGGNSNFLIPANTALNPYVMPEAEELTPSEETGEVEDYEDYEDEEEGDAPAPVTPTAAPAATE